LKSNASVLSRHGYPNRGPNSIKIERTDSIYKEGLSVQTNSLLQSNLSSHPPLDSDLHQRFKNLNAPNPNISDLETINENSVSTQNNNKHNRNKQNSNFFTQ
jgi:hypothetical protein